MRLLNVISFGILISAAVWTGSIYDYSVPRIEGGNQSLSAYQGKKILIITLPLQQNASADSMLYCLDTLGAAHVANLAIIAVPSYEDGYTPALKNQLKQWYHSKLGNYIVVTDGLYTRKTSGAQQHPLFKWLTIVTKNENFDVDVAGPGHKFFARANGELFAVLGQQVKIGGAKVNWLLQTQ